MSTSPEATPVVKLSLTLPQAVHTALKIGAEREERELNEHIQRVLAEHALSDMPTGDAERLKSNWWLVERAVAEAQKLCATGKFAESITIDSIRECMKDPEWIAAYRSVVGDDIYKTGNPLKGPVNREIGFRIVRGIGGIVDKKEGKPRIAKVLGEIIQSYTPIADYDHNRFKAT